MRILYTAIDQIVPGTLGGSTHVQAVAEGLAALGHEVHVAVGAGIADSATRPGSRPGSEPGLNPAAPSPALNSALSPALNSVQSWDTTSAEPAYHDVRTPLGSPNLRLLRRRRLRMLAAAIRPDVVIERYHNFGGEGLLAARAVGARTVLEVNAPVIDYPGSTKRTVDRLLIVEPMRRWREWQCRAADLIVTTDRAILPAGTPAAKVVETDWGADTVRFRPGAAGAVPFARQPGELIAVFAGAFRAWHGVGRLLDAMAMLERRGSPWRAVLIGDGPERPALEARVAAERLTRVAFTGSLPYAAMPAALAAADAGVAPFAPEAHAPLQHGFYWSPLKVFEYMASGLPVVAPSLPRLRAILGAAATGDGAAATAAGAGAAANAGTGADLEADDPGAGVLYDGGEPGALAEAIESLTDDRRRRRLGDAARARAERHYSWAAHCRELETAIAAMCAASRVHAGTPGTADAP